jgi:hypothetical protein
VESSGNQKENAMLGVCGCLIALLVGFCVGVLFEQEWTALWADIDRQARADAEWRRWV